MSVLRGAGSRQAWLLLRMTHVPGNRPSSSIGLPLRKYDAAHIERQALGFAHRHKHSFGKQGISVCAAPCWQRSRTPVPCQCEAMESGCPVYLRSSPPPLQHPTSKSSAHSFFCRRRKRSMLCLFCLMLFQRIDQGLQSFSGCSLSRC